MKVTYRDCVIDAHRAKSLGGDMLLYFSVMHDNYEVTSGFSDCEDTLDDYVGYLKADVDEHLADPDRATECQACERDDPTQKCPTCDGQKVVFDTDEEERNCDTCAATGRVQKVTALRRDQ